MNVTVKRAAVAAPDPGREQPVGPVELVGGPRCGHSVPWPAGQPRAYVTYHDGLAAYQYEGAGTARYLRG